LTGVRAGADASRAWLLARGLLGPPALPVTLLPPHRRPQPSIRCVRLVDRRSKASKGRGQLLMNKLTKLTIEWLRTCNVAQALLGWRGQCFPFSNRIRHRAQDTALDTAASRASGLYVLGSHCWLWWWLWRRGVGRSAGPGIVIVPGGCPRWSAGTAAVTAAVAGVLVPWWHLPQCTQRPPRRSAWQRGHTEHCRRDRSQLPSRPLESTAGRAQSTAAETAPNCRRDHTQLPPRPLESTAGRTQSTTAETTPNCRFAP
jgi:hypothetical protein